MNILFSSIANFKCTPSDREMYPRLGTPALNHTFEPGPSAGHPKYQKTQVEA